LKPAKVFQNAVKDSPRKQITSLTFDDDGKKCVTSGEDDMFTYWDCVSGK
jgi:hypothetical protein